MEIEAAPEGGRKRVRSKRAHRRGAAKRARKANKARGLAAEELAALDAAEDKAARERGIQTFRSFYRLQAILDDETFERLMQAFFQPLPVSFRVCVIGSRQPEVKVIMDAADAWLQLEAQNGGTHLKWAKGWQLGCDERRLKGATKFSESSHATSTHAQVQSQEDGGDGALEAGLARGALGKWLIRANALGVATRQEVVSMLPVALLNITPQHTVLDLCASPGSKTTQALEALYATQRGGSGGEGTPSGFVVANELVGARAHVLAARCAALGAASRSLAVTSHRAQLFPRLPAPGGGGAEGYDRVVCDVPCSGDGTFRKHRDKWTHWGPHQGRELHALQLQIALRAAALLKPGGVMAYSTCSLNPLEDEAVVAALLKRTGGALQLLPCDGKLPGFQAAPGLRTWKVVDEALAPWASRKALLAATGAAGAGAGANAAARFRESMWPPKDGSKTAAALERCLRVYPHVHNTGGFFVALLKKARDWPADDAPADDARQRRTRRPPAAAPAAVAAAAALESCRDALHLLPGRLAAGLPAALAAPPGAAPAGVLYARSAAAPRCFVVSTPLAAHLAAATVDPDAADARCRPLAVVAGGVCVAEREQQASQFPWRLTAVGAEALRSHADPAARLGVSPREARALLAARYQPILPCDAATEGIVYVEVAVPAAPVIPGWVWKVEGKPQLAATVSTEEAERLLEALGAD